MCRAHENPLIEQQSILIGGANADQMCRSLIRTPGLCAPAQIVVVLGFSNSAHADGPLIQVAGH
jgi:hypothetical protein